MMDTFLLKKRNFSEGGEQDEKASASPSTDVVMYSRTDFSGTSLQKVGKHQQYHESYLAFGITYTGLQEKPLPICIICGEKLCNDKIVQSRLKRYFTLKHSHLNGKNTDYFRRLLDEENLWRRKCVKRAIFRNIEVIRPLQPLLCLQHVQLCQCATCQGSSYTKNEYSFFYQKFDAKYFFIRQFFRKKLYLQRKPQKTVLGAHLTIF